MDNNLLRDLRTDYESERFSSKDLSEHPIKLFNQWFDEAIEDGVPEPNAFALSTVDEHSSPHTRIVLLKEIREKGIVFYTSYESVKGKHIAQNPNVAACFFWQKQFRQVRMRGIAEKIISEDSDAYFNRRPYMSRVGAIASPQSKEIESRQWLMDRIEEIKKNEPEEPRRPEYWGGYEIKIQQIEFWQGQPSRLHDRFQYNLKNETWMVKRLAP